MSGSGAPQLSVADARGLRVAVVASQWHAVVMGGLLAGARRALFAMGVADPTVVRVPGAFELPLAVQSVAGRHDAVVALGVVIRGGTPHFDYVCRAATDGLTRVCLDTSTPVGFGLLTCDTEQQAIDRAGLEGSPEDKGDEAARAALVMAALLRDLAGSPKG
ncbi:MAG: 6,7-dimethyl-8-ribityllumazine synthase [Actinomycetota bacterium]|nr:6,7-dimethyl-8-ribityllumazine synthase [Actinomycetota bacterium]MDH5278205.1 6,7-dimethyl-8-ribityllumazine synthase [Actinomycetota bacterium]